MKGSTPKIPLEILVVLLIVFFVFFFLIACEFWFIERIGAHGKQNPDFIILLLLKEEVVKLLLTFSKVSGLTTSLTTAFMMLCLREKL